MFLLGYRLINGLSTLRAICVTLPDTGAATGADQPDTLIVTLVYIDVASRFALSAVECRDTGTRFFLYVPTWKEMQIQAELAIIETRLRRAERKPAQFRI